MIELGFGNANVFPELLRLDESIPVLDVADEGCGASVLRDEDELVRLAGALQACGEVVAALGEGYDVLGESGRGECAVRAGSRTGDCFLVDFSHISHGRSWR